MLACVVRARSQSKALPTVFISWLLVVQHNHGQKVHTVRYYLYFDHQYRTWNITMSLYPSSSACCAHSTFARQALLRMYGPRRELHYDAKYGFTFLSRLGPMPQNPRTAKCGITKPQRAKACKERAIRKPASIETFNHPDLGPGWMTPTHQAFQIPILR